MEEKHTPGPWGVETNTVNYRSGRKALEVRGVSGELIATLPGCERDKANAILIAAAPELLELAKIAESHLRREFLNLAEKYAGTPYENDPAYIHAKQQWDNARAAIDKATGEATQPRTTTTPATITYPRDDMGMEVVENATARIISANPAEVAA